MAHYLFNLSEPDAAQGPAGREQAAARLRVKLWGVDANERHGDRLGPGDLVLIYVGEPERAFVGRAELRTAVHRWTPSEERLYPGDSRSGVVLSRVEGWDPPVPMDAAVRQIDPAGTNPYVQANVRDGFRSGVVEISVGEYESVLAIQAETPHVND
jgi:hypothetical protein